MASSRHRLALPLALSLAGHVVLVFLAGLFVPRASNRAEVASLPSGPSLTLSIPAGTRGPTRVAVKPVEPEGEWIDVGVEPVVKMTPASTSIPADQTLQPTLRSRPGTTALTNTHPGNGSPGTGRKNGSGVVVVPATVRRVVFLLDRSLSMGLSDALDRARIELAAGLRALPPQTLFQVLAYNQAAWPLLPTSSGLIVADQDHVARAIGQLDALTASGVTRHVEAVKAGLRLQPDLLIVLTDADDLSEGDVRLVSQANRGRAVIDVVELTRDPRPQADSKLSMLAGLNRGRHRRVVLGRQ